MSRNPVNQISVADSMTTESMFKVYDTEDNTYFDVREDCGVTIDSEIYYNKKQKRRFSVLPLTRVLSKTLWNIFW